jgi:hypothetical protein
MTAHHHAHRDILIPVLDGDISERVLADAREALADDDARLVVVHVRGRGHQECPRGVVPRWRRLADAAPPHRIFVDVVSGDAVNGDTDEVIASESARFHCDRVLRDTPLAPPTPTLEPTC